MAGDGGGRLVDQEIRRRPAGQCPQRARAADAVVEERVPLGKDQGEAARLDLRDQPLGDARVEPVHAPRAVTPGAIATTPKTSRDPAAVSRAMYPPKDWPASTTRR